MLDCKIDRGRGRRRHRQRPAAAPTSASATGASSRIGDARRGRDPHHRRRRARRRPRLRRHPHPLRRPGVLGPGAHAVAAARRHHRRRRQLRVHDRAARAQRSRLPHAHARPGRGHAARVARSRRPVGLAHVRRVPRPPRRHPRGQRRLPRRALRDPARRDGRRRHGRGGEPRAARRDGSGCSSDSLAAGGLGFSSSQAPTHNDGDGNPVPSRCGHAGRARRRWRGSCATTRARRSSSSPPSARSPTEHVELMTDMSLAANRPLNWNVLGGQLGPARRAREPARGVGPGRRRAARGCWR